MDYLLPELNLLQIKSSVSKEKNTGEFVIEPLSPGYGVTIGNSLRRVLLASLEGSAVKSVKIEGVDHEFSTLKGMKEDVVEFILNLKVARFKLNSDEPSRISLSVKGPAVVTTSDFKETSEIDVVSKDHYLCTIEKGGKLDLEITVDKGRGYLPVEKRLEEKLPIGTILVDSLYTPVKKVKFDVENSRVGSITNYNKLSIEVTTDGSVSPEESMAYASRILVEHFQAIADANTVETKKTKKETKPAQKKVAKNAKKK